MASLFCVSGVIYILISVMLCLCTLWVSLMRQCFYDPNFSFLKRLFSAVSSSDFCVDFFLAIKRHHNWQPIHQSYA